MILGRLQDQIGSILRRGTESHLSRYDYLQRRLGSTNVAIDSEYRSTFNGYYRMQRRSKDWARTGRAKAVPAEEVAKKAESLFR
ncbi:MAG: hypothetical protein HY236_18310 [Acidobacteria bacterium]|nr:hypothetical protein [Acidobacteriota bacterium]